MSAFLRGTSATGKRLGFKKAGGATIYAKRDDYNPHFGGGGGIAPYTLPWAPPTLDNPTTIKVTDATTGVYMDTTKDYIILLPGARGNDLQTKPHNSTARTSSALTISGGRNVTMIGGAVRRDIDNGSGEYIRSSSRFRAVRNRAFYIASWTGVMFIEGVYIGGQHLYETFNVSTTSTAKLYAQNIRVDSLCLKTPDTYGNSNHDGGDAAIENWDGPSGGMYVSHFSVKGTTYQGFFMQPNQFGTAPPAENILQNIDLSYNDPALFNAERFLPWPYHGSKFGSGVQIFVFSKELSRQGPTYVNNVYLNPPTSGTFSDPTVVVGPDKSDTTNTLGQNPKPSYNSTSKIVSWPNLPWVTGEGVRIGKRPGGDLVKNEYVGVGYISPGYDNAAPPAQAPSSAPTLSATPGTQSVSLSWTSVTNATSYKLYRSTSTPVTTSSTLIGDNLTSQNYTDPGLTAGTTYYYGVLAANSTGNGPISSTVSAVPVAPVSQAGTFFSDDFTRADSAIGPNWVDPDSLFFVNSNQAGVPYTSGLSTTAVESKIVTAATPAPGTGDFSFGIEVSKPSTNPTKLHPYVFIASDTESNFLTGNGYLVNMADSTTVANRRFVLARRINGTSTEVGSFTQNYTAPYTLEIKKNGNIIEVRYNGTLIISYTDPSPLSGRYCGVLQRVGGASGGATNTVVARWDKRNR